MSSPLSVEQRDELLRKYLPRRGNRGPSVVNEAAETVDRAPFTGGMTNLVVRQRWLIAGFVLIGLVTLAAATVAGISYWSEVRTRNVGDTTISSLDVRKNLDVGDNLTIEDSVRIGDMVFDDQFIGEVKTKMFETVRVGMPMNQALAWTIPAGTTGRIFMPVQTLFTSSSMIPTLDDEGRYDITTGAQTAAVVQLPKDSVWTATFNSLFTASDNVSDLDLEVDLVLYTDAMDLFDRGNATSTSSSFPISQVGQESPPIGVTSGGRAAFGTVAVPSTAENVTRSGVNEATRVGVQISVNPVVGLATAGTITFTSFDWTLYRFA